MEKLWTVKTSVSFCDGKKAIILFAKEKKEILLCKNQTKWSLVSHSWGPQILLLYLLKKLGRFKFVSIRIKSNMQRVQFAW